MDDPLLKWNLIFSVTFLVFQGDWQSARDRASSTHRWLLVNIQDAKEFQCQVCQQHLHINFVSTVLENVNENSLKLLLKVLNRDLWSNAGVKAIVGEHFVFWQQYKVK